MQLLVGEVCWCEEASVDIALATILVRTSDKGGRV